MHARILKNLAGEEDIVGSNLLRSDGATTLEDSNRHLLIELCRGLGPTTANTHFNLHPENLGTSYNAGAKPKDDASYNAMGNLISYWCRRCGCKW